MGRRNTRFHLFHDCAALTTHRPERRNIIKRSYWYSRGYSLAQVLEDICQLCLAKAQADEGSIEDFNSVWIGLGPDMRPNPVRGNGNNPTTEGA